MAAPRPAYPPSAADLTIVRIGSDGDGVAVLPAGETVYLPLTLPGEAVRPLALTRRGDGWTAASEILTASPERQPAPCPHFGACGGCTLQHWQDAPYAAWKSAQIVHALGRAGFGTVQPATLARTRPGQRRRIDLALLREDGGVRVGLHGHRSAGVVDLHTCLVIEPKLVELIGALRRVLPGIAGLRRAGSAIVNRLDSGIDMLLRTDGPLAVTDRAKLTAMAEAIGACRISWALNAGPPEPACTLHPVQTLVAGVSVSPPPGAFLQASGAGANAITAAVLAGLPDRMAGKPRFMELFAGCGTLTFALAERARTIAYEGDAPSYDALRRAVMGRRVEAILRDLARQPLSVKELKGASAIILDPPYAGAAAQMPGIAASGVERVIYVSCNPGALARDARILHTAGYAVLAVTPIDQFLWSSQVESVTVFTLQKRSR